MTTRTTRTISVKHLARVEGEGALHVQIKRDRVTNVRLEIFEAPRFFEAFLRGRMFTEAPDITARICGICPVAYQAGAIQAMEQICGVTVPDEIRQLRHLMYCGEWIESHALHVFMLHLPDFLGFEDAIVMAKQHPNLVEKALRIKKAGNEVMTVLGGREIHPINMRVGGFYQVPPPAEIRALRPALARSIDDLFVAAEVCAGLVYPELEQDYPFVALQHPEEYAILDGHLAASDGLEIPIEQFEEHFIEQHEPWSNALRGARADGSPYLVGPMARFNLNFRNLSPKAKEAAAALDLAPPCLNPFRSLLVRIVETIHACETAVAIIDAYRPPARSYVDVRPRAGTGFGCTEAPRGICWHRYTIDDAGIIQDARIVPPTAQNQKMMEGDLHKFVSAHLELSNDDLQWKCEQVIRNYDPCISCATHFLKLHIARE
jgi:sulfhydrogenase subunit alpha